MNTIPNDILVAKLLALGRGLANYTERAAIMRMNLKDGWFNEQGAKRAQQSLARYDVLTAQVIDEMRALLVPAPVAKPIPTTPEFKDTEDARTYLNDWHLANFPTDRTFSQYIKTELAGDFTWQLSHALALHWPVAP